MAADLNHVALVGRLTRDVETRTTASGQEIQNMRLAVTSRRKAGETWEDQPNYFDVVMFGGERVKGYLVKGKQLAVSGRLAWREWVTSDGSKRQSVEVVAHDVQLLGGKDAVSGGAADDLPVSVGRSSRAPDDIPF